MRRLWSMKQSHVEHAAAPVEHNTAPVEHKAAHLGGAALEGSALAAKSGKQAGGFEYRCVRRRWDSNPHVGKPRKRFQARKERHSPD